MKNLLTIKECTRKGDVWEITTTCGKDRTVMVAELRKEMCGPGGMVSNVEGLDRPVTFAEFLDWMELGFNRQQLWYRLAHIVTRNENKLISGARVAQAFRDTDADADMSAFMNHERSNMEDAQHHEHIERMNREIEFRNTFNNPAA